MQKLKKVFVALGGNIGNSAEILDDAVKLMSCSPFIGDLHVSPYYKTSPIGMKSDQLFVNAVCHFKTTLEPFPLLEKLKEIEKSFGKMPFSHMIPRPIDLDILFYEKKKIFHKDLIIPHPRWQERLFVLKPLSDLVNLIEIPQELDTYILFDVEKYIKDFPNLNGEVVTRLERRKL